MAGAKHGLISPPGPRLRKFIPLKFVSKHGMGGKKSTYAELNLTSMVDMLTILVVFLLQTFSASGELSVSKNVTLPQAINYKDIEQAPMVAISRDVVTLDGRPMANADELNRDNSIDWKIPQLHDDLVVLKNNFKLLHPNPEDWKGLVLLQGDRNIDFKVLKKVMYTCTVAGYTNINFAVQQKPKGSGG